MPSHASGLHLRSGVLDFTPKLLTRRKISYRAINDMNEPLEMASAMILIVSLFVQREDKQLRVTQCSVISHSVLPRRGRLGAGS